MAIRRGTVLLVLLLVLTACQGREERAADSGGGGDVAATTEDGSDAGAGAASEGAAGDASEPAGDAGASEGDAGASEAADGGSEAEGSESAGASGGSGDFAGTDTVRFGFIAPLTGPLGFIGEFQRNSLQVAVDRINAEGGVGGAQVEIVERDQALDPARAVQAAQEFASDDSVVFVIGPGLTSFYNAVAPTFEQAQKVNCQPLVASGDFAQYEFGFRNQNYSEIDTEVLLDYAQEQGVQRFGLVYEDDDTGRGYDEALRSAAEARGMEYLGGQFTRPDDQSHVPYVQALQDADAIFISNTATGAILSAVAAEEIGFDGQLLSGSGVGATSFVEAAGEAALRTTFVATPTTFSTRVPEEEWPEGYRDHVTVVVERFGATEGPETGYRVYNGTAITADCAYFYDKAAEEAGSLDPVAVADAWEQMEYTADETPSSVEGSFGAEHEGFSKGDLVVYTFAQDDEGIYLEEVARGTDD